MNRWISSAALRLFAKQRVRCPCSTRLATIRAASPSALARWLSSTSRSGGFQQDDCAFSPRRRVVGDNRRLEPRQLESELRGVRDRRRGEQELRLRAVDPREPPQAAQDVADVRAEHAAVDVRLVDDDVREVREHVSPAVVVGKDADVEHVRVREDRVRPRADLASLLDRRVAVVDRRADALHADRGEAARLVLRERLRRVEVERARLRVARDRVEHGQVERQRLAACRPGRDDEMLASLGRVPRLRLVGVERSDAAPLERIGDEGVDAGRQRCEAGGTGGLERDVGDLLSREQLAPRRRDAHASATSSSVRGSKLSSTSWRRATRS